VLEIRLALTFFDMKNGPQIIATIPKPIEKDKEDLIEKLMDLSMHENAFFEHIYQEENFFGCANTSFSVPSRIARGGQDLLMLSFISEEELDLSVFKPVLQKYVKKIVKIKDIYKGLYKGTDFEVEESEKYRKKLIKILKDCFEEGRKIPEIQKPGKMLILGITKVGKTSIIKRITEKKFDPNIKPTLGMQIIKSVIDNFQFRIYDVGGQKRMRDKWFESPKPDAIIYVFDCTAEDQTEAIKEFNKVYSYYFKNANNENKLPQDTPILILINKIDICNNKLTDKKLLKMLKIKNKHLNYKIGCVSAKTGENLEKYFKWLVKAFLFV